MVTTIGKNRPTHENGERSMLIDINGDGLLDRVFDKTQRLINKDFLSIQNHTKPRLKVITNGFGIQTTLNYKPLTDSSVYTKGPKKGYYPNISIQNAAKSSHPLLLTTPSVDKTPPLINTATLKSMLKAEAI
ncbi:hypothetical protein BSPWISOXPB_8814 [uncultured Gammaproteobacteria bacterium]|nr:hypothetical protein BSPWISOXPB_8814 [uncultured Gammaproteobacteria bacterium]